MSKSVSQNVSSPTSAWLKDLAALFKLRLTLLVVMSSVFGYLMATTNGGFSWAGLILLIAAGILITGASNTFNQVIEVEQDALMSRTVNRPLVRKTVRSKDAIIIASISGIIGVAILYLTFGQLSAVLGLMALVSYAAIYTPLKRISSWSVFVGAFPGAIPPMLGYVAASDTFGLVPGLLFATQFIWQFVHFWAIAWVLDDDYKKAGFHMLPSKGGRDMSSAYLILVYTLFVFPVSILPWVFGITGVISLIVCILSGMVLLVPALRLFRTRELKYARQLMFASFIHLPVVQLVYVLDKL